MWRLMVGIPLFFRGDENFIFDPEGFLIHHKWTGNVVNIKLQQVLSRRLSLTRQILETDTLPFRKLCKSTARKRDEWKNQTKFNCRLHDLFRRRDFFSSFIHHRQIHSRGWHDENFFNFSLKPYAGKISSHDSIYVTLKLEWKRKESWMRNEKISF